MKIYEVTPMMRATDRYRAAVTVTAPIGTAAMNQAVRIGNDDCAEPLEWEAVQVMEVDEVEAVRARALP